MPRPVALHVSVSMSPPGRMTVHDSQGRRVVDPDWVSLDADVSVEVDDGTRVVTPEPMYGIGGPLHCSRQELDERLDNLVYREPPPGPGDPGPEADQLIRALRARGADATPEILAALPRRITVSDEVEARLEDA